MAVFDHGRHRHVHGIRRRVPILPVYLGEIKARCLGADVQAWDPDGKPLIDEVGELVITRPMPTMPVFFWGVDGGSRLRESYFEMSPGAGVMATGSRSRRGGRP